MAYTTLIADLNAQLATLRQQLGKAGEAACKTELAQIQAAIATGDQSRIEQALKGLVKHTIAETRSLVAQTHGGFEFNFFSPEKRQVIDCSYKHQLAEGAENMLDAIQKSRTKLILP